MKNEIIKRILSIMLSLVLVFTMMPMVPGAVNEAQAAEIEYETISVSSWDELGRALELEASLNIVLSNDIKHKIPVGTNQDNATYFNVIGNKVLDLNGYSIDIDDRSNSRDDDNSWLFRSLCHRTLFAINKSASLTVNDSGGDGQILFRADMIGVHLYGVLFGDIERLHRYATRDIFSVYGSLTINGGTFSAGNTKEQYIHNKVCYAEQIARGHVIIANSNSNVIVNGGTLIGHSIGTEDDETASTLKLWDESNVVINGGSFVMKGCGKIIDRGASSQLKIYKGSFVSNSYEKIRILNDDSMQENAVKDGFIAGYGIDPKVWKHRGIKVAIDNVDMTDKIDTLDFAGYNGGGIVSFETSFAEGSVGYTSGAQVGKAISFYLTGDFKKLQTDDEAITYQWQVLNKEEETWEDISGGDTAQYTIPSSLLGSQIRLKVFSPEYAGEAVGGALTVVKQTNYEEPYYPALIVDYANKQITVRSYSGYKSTQEYVITTSSDKPTENQWADSSLKPNSSGKFTNLTDGKTYYVHTRFKETDTAYAGKVVYSTRGDMKETVPLTGFELKTGTDTGRYAQAGEYVRVYVVPVPYNATNYGDDDSDGVLGKNWYTNDNAKIYANSKGAALDPNKYYDQVYVKADSKETVTVSAEQTIGYNNIVRGDITFDFCDSNGHYSFKKTQTSFDPDTITVGRGSTATTRIYSDITPDKPIHLLSFAHDSYTDLSGVTIERIGDSNEILITASEDATLGKGGYRPTVNGDAMTNCLYINVVEENIPVDLVKISTMAKKIKPGEMCTLSATVTPSNATDKKITWSSSDSSIAKVDSNGVVTGVKNGTVTITAKAGDKTATCKIVVDSTLNAHLVYVERGTASKDSAKAGETVTITADDLHTSLGFVEWKTDDVTLASTTAKSTSFTMPDHEVSITAVYDIAAPTNIKIAPVESTGKPKVTWDAVEGADKYEIWRKVGSSGTYAKYDTTTGTSYTNSSTTPGTVYYYKVLAVCGDSKSEFSKEVYMARDLPQPTNVKIAPVVETGKPKVTWNAVEGASKYEIYRKVGSSGTYKKYDTTTGTSYTNSSTTPGTVYYYKVLAVCGTNSGGNSALSKEVYMARDLPQPTNVKIAPVVETGKPKVTWNAVEGASKYEIWRKVGSSGTYKKYDTTTGTSYTNSSTTPGIVYYYKVLAVCGTNSGGNSALSKEVYMARDLPQPTNVKIAPVVETGKPKVTWNAVEGASKYEIWRKVGSSGTYKKYDTTTGTSYTNSSTTPGTVYYYKVLAVCGTNSGGNSALSKEVYMTCDLAQPKASVALTTSGKPKVSWKAVSGASKYEIWRKVGSSGTYKKYDTTTNTSYANTSTTAGTTYYYQIKAICTSNSAGNSALSKEVYVTSK